jgi:hypothetical protein
MLELLSTLRQRSIGQPKPRQALSIPSKKTMFLKLAGFFEAEIKVKNYLELTSERFFDLLNRKVEEKESVLPLLIWVR